jgi:regulation of enolase protein 1 (concanavalin A-like superfamily)
MTTLTQTDFWLETHYGYTRLSGHARLAEATGDFTAAVTVSGDYRDLYDQAGLFVFADDRNWLKAGLEFTSGHLHMSTVLTRDYSDWSVLKLPPDFSGPVHLRITRLGAALLVDYSLDGASFDLVRLSYLPLGDEVEVGPMACSPVGPGFAAAFTDFAITTPSRTGDQ